MAIRRIHQTALDGLIKMHQKVDEDGGIEVNIFMVVMQLCTGRYTQSIFAAWMACELCVPDDRVHEFLLDMVQCLGHPLLIKAPDSAGGNRQQQKHRNDRPTTGED